MRIVRAILYGINWAQALHHFSRSDYEKALKNIEKCEQFVPGGVEILSLRTSLLYSMKNYELVEEASFKAISAISTSKLKVMDQRYMIAFLIDLLNRATGYHRGINTFIESEKFDISGVSKHFKKNFPLKVAVISRLIKEYRSLEKQI